MTFADDSRRVGAPSTESVTSLASELECRIEEYDDRAECTLFPTDVSEDELVTTWVTASDDAFVPLADAR